MSGLDKYRKKEEAVVDPEVRADLEKVVDDVIASREAPGVPEVVPATVVVAPVVKKEPVAPKAVINQSIKSLRLDMALVEFVHKGKSVRMKQILEADQFRLLSESSLRHHLKSLCAKEVLTEDKRFRGTYAVAVAGYGAFREDCSHYLRSLVGDDLFSTLRERESNRY